jgi:hypothetical protein
MRLPRRIDNTTDFPLLLRSVLFLGYFRIADHPEVNNEMRVTEIYRAPQVP